MRQPNSDKPPMSAHPDEPTFPPGDVSDLAHLLRSPPPVPSSPAPAYTALPHRDVSFHLAPLLCGQVGDIELESTDGKRFLVHRRILEQETVFFHIYYGFVPVWRLAAPHIGPPHPNLLSTPPQQHTVNTAAGALNNLLCLPKFIASHLRAASPSAPAPTQQARPDTIPLLSADGHSTCSDVDDSMESDSYDRPPPLPPKDVTAPTPTTSPYTWAVPEHSSILASFLSLIYPRGSFAITVEDSMPTLDVTSRVIRAAMGYQSSKAVSLARNRLYAFAAAEPVETYAMACFFKFRDLARLTSQAAIAVHPEAWSSETKALMGKSGARDLMQLRESRMAGLRCILNAPMERDAHSGTCMRMAMIQELWDRKIVTMKEGLQPQSDLLELLEVDLRGGHCGDCLLLLGSTIQRSLLAARDLPRSI